MTESLGSIANRPSVPRGPSRHRVVWTVVVAVVTAIILGWLTLSAPAHTVNGKTVTCSPLLGDIDGLWVVDTELELSDIWKGESTRPDYTYQLLKFDADLIARCAVAQQSRQTQVNLTSVLGATGVLLLMLVPRREDGSLAAAPRDAAPTSEA